MFELLCQSMVLPLESSFFLLLSQLYLFGFVVVHGVNLRFLGLRLDVVVHLVLEHPMEEFSIFIETERFLLNLIDLIEPKSILSFSVTISLSFIRLGDIIRHRQTCLTRNDIVPTWWNVNRLWHHAVFLLFQSSFPLHTLMVLVLRLTVRNPVHLRNHVIFGRQPWHTARHTPIHLVLEDWVVWSMSWLGLELTAAGCVAV